MGLLNLNSLFFHNNTPLYFLNVGITGFKIPCVCSASANAFSMVTHDYKLLHSKKMSYSFEPYVSIISLRILDIKLVFGTTHLPVKLTNCKLQGCQWLLVAEPLSTNSMH